MLWPSRQFPGVHLASLHRCGVSRCFHGRWLVTGDWWVKPSPLPLPPLRGILPGANHLPVTACRRPPAVLAFPARRPRVPSRCGRRRQRRLAYHVRCDLKVHRCFACISFLLYSFGLDAHGRIWIVQIFSRAEQRILVLFDFPPSYHSLEDKLINTGKTSEITPEVGHKPLLLYLQIGGRHARRRPASIRWSQARLNGSWRTLAGPLLHPLLCAVVNSRCTVCARQNYLVEDSALFIWFRPRLLAPAVPVFGDLVQLQHLHLASITEPCYCSVAAPSLHSVCTPAFGFVASSEITNQTQPKSSTTPRNFWWAGNQLDSVGHSPSHWLCGSLFFPQTHRRTVYHYIILRRWKMVFNPYAKHPYTHPKNFALH